MIVPRSRPPICLLLAALLFGASGAVGQENDPSADAVPALPRDINIEWVGQLRQTGDGEYEFTGPVTVSWRQSRIQADRLTLKEQRFVEADGNVLIAWGSNRIYGSRMTYDLETETGVITDAMGQVESDYLFWARTAEKIGEDRVRIKHATVTTCTQPVPYWSFFVSTATIHLDHYAYMWNAVMRGHKVPFLYLPYLVWPVKEDRAAGLLMPDFASTEERGYAVSQQLFIPLGRSADLTLLGRYYTEAGFGGGGEFRFLPNRRGSALLSGFYIYDKVVEQRRYQATYKQTQEFNNGFRMFADMNFVSDRDYYSDFERSLSLVSTPQVLARLEFSRNGKWTSMNVRQLRRKQLSNGLVQKSLPEIEFRGRSRRLGRSPLYLAYESSVANISQSQGSVFRADYYRGDLAPTISMPWSPRPWLDITPTVRYRWTYYTQRFDPADSGDILATKDVVDDSLSRQLWSAGLTVIGPRLFRLFEGSKEPGSPRYKHVIEPQLTYGYGKPFDRADEIILFDEVDTVSGAGNQVVYALVQRLFAERPRSTPRLATDRDDRIVLPDGTVRDPETGEPSDEFAFNEPEPPVATGPMEPLEIATLELRQSRSFDQELSFADLDGDGVVGDASSPYSDLQLIARYNPARSSSFDLRSSYDILYHDIKGATLSGAWQNRMARLRFSLVFQNGLGVNKIGDVLIPREDDLQLRLGTSFSLLRGRLQIALDGSYDSNPAPGQSHVPDKRWKIQYSTQCCTFYLERLTRDFTTTQRDDFYLRVDLRGVGKLFRVTY